MQQLINLEPLCAEYGLAIIEARHVHGTKLPDCSNVINKAIGVLVENGLYSMSVFLVSCNQSDYGTEVFRVLAQLLSDPRVSLLKKISGSMVETLPGIRELTKDLPSLILARRLIEQALTFGRYHCKAINREN